MASLYFHTRAKRVLGDYGSRLQEKSTPHVALDGCFL